ncbi:UPF0223 family protein [Bacillus sp. 165]|uniref:UPF0223 family protein n=1 Tax=Bacillus sp. 165 TaxID=1529117 RepID=UPI001ADCBC1A|nr:UPF0223 family protein [Bacillus sp. 165]MBO9130318.1 UPF0223 family protein [Bacillus sp. 165]
MDYQYPLDYHWSTKEIVDVIKFYESVEQAYEQGISRLQLMDAYRRFKEIVPSKAEEKKIDAAFEEITGYSLYRAVQKAKTKEIEKIIKM